MQSSLRNHRFVDEEKDLLAIVGQPPLGIIGEEEGGISTGYNLPRDPGYGALKKFLMAWTIDSDGNITEKKILKSLLHYRVNHTMVQMFRYIFKVVMVTIAMEQELLQHQVVVRHRWRW